MKRNKEKITRENIYRFMIDKENKALIIAFLSFLGMIIIFSVISGLWQKILLYYLFYVLVVKKYDKAVSFLLKDKLKQYE